MDTVFPGIPDPVISVPEIVLPGIGSEGAVQLVPSFDVPKGTVIPSPVRRSIPETVVTLPSARTRRVVTGASRPERGSGEPGCEEVLPRMIVPKGAARVPD
jgi:hypothetical protein